MTIKPLVFSVGDTVYYERYAKAFEGSAHDHGMQTYVINVGDIGSDACFLRWQILPFLLNRHPGVIMVDLDSVIQKPISFADDIDIGLFFRHDAKSPLMRTLCAAVYLKETAIEWAEEMAKLNSGNNPEWCSDQGLAYEMATKYSDKYNIVHLGKEILDWDKTNPDCAIFTAKGPIKKSPEYKRMLRYYENEIRPT